MSNPPEGAVSLAPPRQDPLVADAEADEVVALIPPAVAATPLRVDPALPSVAMVTVLRVVGRNAQLELSPEQSAFTLGGASAPSVDLTLDGDGVSRLHARLVRRGPKLRVLDQQSTNGTYFRGRLDPDFEIAPGDVFQVTQAIKLLALDEPLQLLRSRLQWVLGLRAHAAVDEALEVIARNAPILLIGPSGCEQRAIAEEIHRRSAFHDRDFVVAPHTFATRAEADAKLAHAVRGTLYLDLTSATEPLPNHFVSRVFGGDTRPIVVAASAEHAAEILDFYALRLSVIRIPPLAARPDDIPRLLDALILQLSAQRGEKNPAPIAALGDENLAGLKAHGWPGNFAELRRAVPRLHAVLASGLVLRAAARSLGHQTHHALAEALKRINVRIGAAGDPDDVGGRRDDEEMATPPVPLGASGVLTTPGD